MITAEEREESFKRDLIELLKEHGAELDIYINDNYGRCSEAEVFVSMGSRGDGDIVTHQYCDFNLPNHLP